MKKFLLRTMLFLATAVVAYVLALWLLGDLGWVRAAAIEMGDAGHLNSRVKDVRNYRDVDVLFVGSSHCYRTFDTRFYADNGFSSFNLGSSNQTPMQTYVLLSAYLDSIRPKQVVFEVHPDIMGNDGVESAVNLLANVPLTSESAAMALRMGNMKVVNSFLYAFYSQKVRHRLESFHEDTVIGHYHYIPGGFCEVDTCEFVRKRYPKTDVAIRPEQMAALKDCIRLLRDRGIPFTLVEVQDAEQLRSSIRNHAWFEQQMSALGPYRYKVLPMVDTVHFFNSNHLHTPGIELFNQDFVQYLKNAVE